MPFDWADSWVDWLECEIHFRHAKTQIDGTPPVEDPRLAAIQERAMATITYGDVFTYMDVGRQQVSRREWSQAAINFIKVLDQLPPGIRASSQQMHFFFEMVQRPEVFAKLVELRPEDMRLWYARGRTFASSREWTKASSDYEKSLELLTKTLLHLDPADRSVTLYGGLAVGLELAALKLLSGDELGYRDLCKSLMKTQVLADEHFVASHLSRASTLLPDTMTDWSIPLKWAGQSVAFNLALPGICIRWVSPSTALDKTNTRLRR